MSSSSLPLVQWSFFQYKKNALSKSTSSPVPCFLHSCCQIGSKLLIYGGCDNHGDALSSLFMYDTATYQWNLPKEEYDFQEDHPGPRYGHSATVVEMHPPKIMVFGGIVGGGTFEFDVPDGVEGAEPSSSSGLDIDNLQREMQRTFMNTWRRKGKAAANPEEADDRVFFLELKSDKWIWTKPLVHGGKTNRPKARTEHSACKIGTNEVCIFGGWAGRPVNDVWIFNFVDMEWKLEQAISGIWPRARFRHSCELVNNVMYILGGSDNSEDVSDGCKYLGIHGFNLDSREWIHPELRGISPFPRSGHGSTVIGSRSIAIFGGKRNSEVLLNDTIIIDTSTFSTTVVNAVASHLPSPIANSSLNSIGNKCFVFGGVDTKGSCFNDIRMLDVNEYLDSSDVSVGVGASSDYCFKILVIGDASVGKSSLLTRFSSNIFMNTYTATIGIDFNSKMIRVDKAICKLEIWDTAGQERFSTITANYYRGAQGAILVYDVGRRDSFEHIQNWYDRAKQLGGENMETILVGNKSDISELQREVSTIEGETKAADLEIPFVETSALNGFNVEKAFVSMTATIKKSVDRRGLTGVQASSLQRAGGVVMSTGERKKTLSERCGCS